MVWTMDDQEHKADHFQQSLNNKFQCLLCDKVLSSKQRVLLHLHAVHSCSPVKPVKKLYMYTDSHIIPKTTLLRKRGLISSSSACASSSHKLKTLDDRVEDIAVSDTLMMNSEDEICTLTSQHSNFESDSSLIEESLGVVVNETENVLSQKCDSDIAYSDGSCEDSTTSNEEDSSSCDSDTSETSSASVDLETPVSQTESKTDLNSLGIASFILRYNLSKASSESLLALLKAMCPGNETIKDLTFSKVFKEVNKSDSKLFHYCKICLKRFPEDVNAFKCLTKHCEGLRYEGKLSDQEGSKRKPCAYYIICDIAFHLKLLLEREGIMEEINRNKQTAQQTATEMSDIYQGKAYQNLCEQGKFISFPGTISGILNTDGIPLYSSSKVKLWPIYIAINELSITHRFSRENTILAGIWQGSSNPPFLEYFLSLADELKGLYEDRVTIATNSGEQIVKLCVCLATVDLQAKAYVTGMTMHNGQYGCITCEEPGVTVKQGKGFSRSYPYRSLEDKPQMRDSENIKTIIAPTASLSERKKGIAGPSGFMAMPWFDLVNGITPDYMHGVLMGVTKVLLYLWLSPTQTGKPYFIGKSVKTISHSLKNITPPKFVQRLPRDLEKHYNNLKATELQTWLLFYGYPCVKDILPEKYLEHFCMLSEGIYLLLGDCITSAELDRAETLLDKFYNLFTTLYEPGKCGLNVHNIGAHLVYYVRQWGPLYCWRCFGFEDNNAELLKSVHGTGDVTKQIINTRLAELYIKSTNLAKLGKDIPSWALYASKICPNTDGSSKCIEDICQLDEGTSTVQLGDKTRRKLVFEKIGINKKEECKVSYRVVLHGQNIYSENYTRMRKRHCYTVLCENGLMFRIKYFIQNVVTGVIYAVGNHVTLHQPVFPFEDAGHHMFNVKMEDGIDVVPSDSIREEMFVICVQKTAGYFHQYASRVPNLYGRSVFK